ncbi:MAG: O-antigen ligase family protein [Actinobacteria bacterium]|nr:O-antigen ligase family protein [Actinomycetota bacterium]
MSKKTRLKRKKIDPGHARYLNQEETGGVIGDGPIRFIQICLILVAVALPLFMLPPTYSVFDLPKAMLLIVLASLIGCAWVIKVARDGRLIWRRTPLDIPLALLFMVVVGSTLFSINPGTSLTGPSISDRHESFSVWVAYLLIAAAASQFLVQRKVLLAFLKAVVLTATGISIYAIFQHFGIDYFQYDVSGLDIIRPPGTLGQPTYLGTYLVLALPISYALTAVLAQKLQRLGYALSAGVIGVALIFTYTRGAWLAAIIAVLFTMFYAFSRQSQHRVRLLGLALCVFLVVLLAALFSGSFDLVSERVSSALNLTGSASERLVLWKSTLNLIRERPLLGWGVETFEDIFPLVETLALLKTHGVVSADRPHNQALYISFSMGIIGFLAYLWFLVAVFLAGLRAVRSTSERFFLALAGIMGAFLGYIISEQFLFSVVGATPIFYALAGVLQVKSDRVSMLEVSRQKALGLQVASVIIVVIVLVMVGTFTAADVFYERGNEALGEGEPIRALDYYEMAVRVNPWHEWYALALVNTAASLSLKNPDFSWKTGVALPHLERAIERNPYNRDLYVALGDLYLSQAMTGDTADYEKSIAAYQDAIERSPLLITAHLQLGRVLFVQGKPEEALYHLDLVTKLQPENEIARELVKEIYRR